MNDDIFTLSPENIHRFDGHVAKPGEALDKHICEVLFDGKCIEQYLPHFSTYILDAWSVWGWLERNSPWDTVAMMEDRESGKPCVRAMRITTDNTGEIIDFIQPKFVGESYPHAICLAVLAAYRENNPLMG